MSGELEAAGAAATAGLAAGVIEGKGGGRGGEGACPNCGAALAGAYCAVCGQPAQISRTLGHVLGDFAHAFLHFDTKAWRTVPMLVGRPGTLTHRYIHGQRARFVSPLAMFLLTIFLMFFVFSLAGGPNIGRAAEVNGSAERAQTLEEAREDVRKAEAEAAQARIDLAAAEAEAETIRASNEPGADGMATGVVAGPRAQARTAEHLLKRSKERLSTVEARQAVRAKAIAAAKEDLKTEAPAVSVAVEGAAEDDRPWQERLREAVEKGKVKPNTGWPALDARILNHLRNPDLALYKLQEVAYKFSFLLVPITLPFIAFLFLWKRGVTLFDHVVFSLYSLSFMSLLFMALALLARAGEWTEAPVAIAALAAPPTHMFFQLKGTYALGWWSALWRTLALLVMTFVALVVFMVTVLLLGVFS